MKLCTARGCPAVGLNNMCACAGGGGGCVRIYVSAALFHTYMYMYFPTRRSTY